MQMVSIESDVLMFVGDYYESVATAFIRGSDALLVDTLANLSDAEWMHRCLVAEMGKTVRVIVTTHFMHDHIAGMRLYPEAQIVAQHYYRHTFQSQRGLRTLEYDTYLEPHIIFGDSLSLQWGRHTLKLFHNPGKTLCSTNIDVPSCDLAFTADNMVGHIVYLSRSSPELIDQALAKLQSLRRSRMIGGHMGMFDQVTLSHARFYLRRLRDLIVNIHRTDLYQLDPDAVRSIPIESCLAPGISPAAFEREWHGRNLDIILEQNMFKLDAIRTMQRSSIDDSVLTLDHIH